MNRSFQYRRLFLTGAILLLVMAVTLPVFAQEVVNTTLHIEGGPDVFDCSADGFTAIGHFSLDLHITEFFDGAGNLVRATFSGSFRGTVTRTDTGVFLRDMAGYHETVDFTAGTDTVVGLPVHWHVPGKGTFIFDAGKVVFDLDTGEILYEAGPHPVLHGFPVNWPCDVLK